MSQNEETIPKSEGWEGDQEINFYKSSEKNFSFFFTFSILLYSKGHTIHLSAFLNYTKRSPS